MVRNLGILLLAIAAIGVTLATADDAQARHRRGGGSCGSWGGSGGSWGGGSNGSWGGHGSRGSFGGLFSRRGGNDCCYEESDGGCADCEDAGCESCGGSDDGEVYHDAGPDEANHEEKQDGEVRHEAGYRGEHADQAKPMPSPAVNEVRNDREARDANQSNETQEQSSEQVEAPREENQQQTSSQPDTTQENASGSNEKDSSQ